MQDSYWTEFANHFKAEWVVISGAPFLSLLLVIAAAFITWFFVHFHFKNQIAALEAHVKLHKDRADNPVSAIPPSRMLNASVPNIAGHWVRQIYAVPGVLSLAFDGHKLSGTFKEGNCDHVIEGTYNEAKKQFDVRTERIDRANPSADRFVQLETYWLVGNDRIYFENPRNVNGVFESGFLKRKDS